MKTNEQLAAKLDKWAEELRRSASKPPARNQDTLALLYASTAQVGPMPKADEKKRDKARAALWKRYLRKKKAAASK